MSETANVFAARQRCWQSWRHFAFSGRLRGAAFGAPYTHTQRAFCQALQTNAALVSLAYDGNQVRCCCDCRWPLCINNNCCVGQTTPSGAAAGEFRKVTIAVLIGDGRAGFRAIDYALRRNGTLRRWYLRLRRLTGVWPLLTFIIAIR